MGESAILEKSDKGFGRIENPQKTKQNKKTKKTVPTNSQEICLEIWCELVAISLKKKKKHGENPASTKINDSSEFDN